MPDEAERRFTGFYIEPLVWAGEKPPGLEPPLPPYDAAIPAMTRHVANRDLLDGRLPCWIAGDGLVAFDFSLEAPSYPVGHPRAFERDFLQRRVAIANAYLACLSGALGKLEKRVRTPVVAVSPHSFLDLHPDEVGAGLPKAGGGAAAHAARTVPSGFAAGALPMLIHRDVIGLESLNEALRMLDEALAVPHIIDMLDLVFRSVSAHEDHEFALSLTQSWAVIEALIRRLWARYVDENRQRGDVAFINGPRKKGLIESRDWTASMITEVLSLVDQVPLDLYENLNDARRARNNWLHSLTPPSDSQSAAAIATATQALELVDGFPIHIPLGLTW